MFRFFLSKVLEDTGDAATQNVDRVKKENVRVSERLRKKRAAMFASWCMMITVRLLSPTVITCAPAYVSVYVRARKRERERWPIVHSRRSFDGNRRDIMLVRVV